METLLIAEWLPAPDAIPTLDEASLSLARDRIREMATAHAIDSNVAARAMLVATELGRNHLRHAAHGCIGIAIVQRRNVDGEPCTGIEIIAADRGVSIADVRRALDGTPRTSGSLGVGLAAVRENALEVDFDLRQGEGSCIRARVFGPGVPRRREVGVYGRPIAEERVSGDHAYFWRDRDRLIAVVCDGLGHGPPAREAADAAIAALRPPSSTAPVPILQAAHEGIGRARGAVMAVTCIDEDTGSLETASIGNITVQLTAYRKLQRFGGSSAILGARQSPFSARSETAQVASTDVLVMMTDGLKTRVVLEEERDLLREHPIIIAQELIAQYARTNDDALVLVAR